MGEKRCHFAVLGAGSWGTALAMQLARNGHPTILWGHRSEVMQAMAQSRVNQRYLPDFPLPQQLNPSADLQATLAQSEQILIVVPSHAFRQTLQLIKPYLKPGQAIAWATKGLPTAVTVAANNADYASLIAHCLHGGYFRAYTSADITGVEIGGAVKNVLAIATGIADGLGFGANTRSAIITRGLAEMMRLGVAVGGLTETFMGLAGLGDLVLTCTDNQSRNRRFGLALGQGSTIEAALASIDQVVEGLQTAREVHQLAEQLGIEMPITSHVYKVLYEGLNPSKAVDSLLGRDLRQESDT
jgi:glycerol-3-phosphate dehydrogenase (NAD(P)+)